MKDSHFKKLAHQADNYTILATGTEIAKGYKPDVILQNANEYIIMECDTNTTRKGFIVGIRTKLR